jgi:hypothetical protein
MRTPPTRQRRALKQWEQATEYMKLDAIGVFVKDQHGVIEEHKLGRQAGKRCMGIGVALGVIAAIPTGGFFHKGIKITNQELARIVSQLDAGQAAVRVLSWDSETEAVAAKLTEQGGAAQTRTVATLTTESQ